MSRILSGKEMSALVHEASESAVEKWDDSAVWVYTREPTTSGQISAS